MKRLFFSSIVFLILCMGIALGDVAIYPTSESVSTYAGENITKTVKITNTNSTLPISLQTSVSFTEGSVTVPISVKYNVTNPLPVPSPGNSVDVAYTLVVPPDMESGTYTGTINFENSPLAFTLGVVGRLYVDDLDVTVDNVLEDEEDSDKNLDDGDTISTEVRPGSKVSFDFRIGNAFTDSQNIEINDVVIEVTIDDIDDGDELEGESDDFDIDADDKSDRVSIEFDIPLEVDEGDYNVYILITGEDEENVDHEIEWELELQVEKESHFIYIKEVDLSPSTVKCDRSATLDVELINLGSRAEDEVILEIKNTALGIDIKEEELELDEDYDDDNTYDGSYSLNVDNDAAPGTYTITIKSFYKENKLSDTDTVSLVVEDCEIQQQSTTTTQTTTPPPSTTTPQTTQQTTVPQYTQQPSQPTIINPPIITQPEQSSVEVSFMNTPAYVIILVLVNVIGIAVIIFLVTKTLIRK
ncbi:hypothetical protein KY360_01650 [Candidatus Woesearchaeota archaeon]|nr:hypothetical protein [Candidatus Woesearchaeota archaeon]